ncbi:MULTISPECIES: hypothetical protein [Bacillus]|nr:hypothetical protein [Bacillus cereus]WJE23246.1 hypothetical protein QRE65_01635 [Bacillus cereus]
MMKKIVLATLGLVITLVVGLNSEGDTQHALKKEEIIQYSHADHF